jgi:hypothetical protein
MADSVMMRYQRKSWLYRLSVALRSSLLLSLVAFGLVMAASGLAIEAGGHSKLAGIVGASGLVISVINLVMYISYKVMEALY